MISTILHQHWYEGSEDGWWPDCKGRRWPFVCLFVWFTWDGPVNEEISIVPYSGYF